MDDVLSQAKALKDRLILEKRFDEASKIRDLIRTIEGVGEAEEALKRLLVLYASEPVAAPKKS